MKKLDQHLGKIAAVAATGKIIIDAVSESDKVEKKKDYVNKTIDTVRGDVAELDRSAKMKRDDDAIYHEIAEDNLQKAKINSNPYGMRTYGSQNCDKQLQAAEIQSRYRAQTSEKMVGIIGERSDQLHGDLNELQKKNNDAGESSATPEDFDAIMGENVTGDLRRADLTDGKALSSLNEKIDDNQKIIAAGEVEKQESFNQADLSE